MYTEDLLLLDMIKFIRITISAVFLIRIHWILDPDIAICWIRIRIIAVAKSVSNPIQDPDLDPDQGYLWQIFKKIYN
jgi:hypothetical protein